MAGLDLPTRAIREQIAGSIHLVVQQARFVDGSRKITQIAEVVGIEDDGQVRLENIFEFHRLSGARGEVRRRVPRHRLHAVVLERVHHHGPRAPTGISYEPVGVSGAGAAHRSGRRVRRRDLWMERRRSELRRARWREYETWANGKLRGLYSPLRARDFAIRHGLFIVGGLVLGIGLGSTFFGVVLAVLGGYLPVVWIERQEAQRKKNLEAQLDATLQSLANTILVTQNLEDAFATIAQHFDPPMSQEADVLVKQVRLGTPMDEALRQLATRCRSRNVDAIVTALTVGRQTGGELPKVLETTAGVLRETMRVEGVMEAKTSEGKAQVVVMGLLPFRLWRRAAGDRSRMDGAAVSRSRRLGRPHLRHVPRGGGRDHGAQAVDDRCVEDDGMQLSNLWLLLALFSAAAFAMAMVLLFIPGPDEIRDPVLRGYRATRRRDALRWKRACSSCAWPLIRLCTFYAALIPGQGVEGEDVAPAAQRRRALGPAAPTSSSA